MAISVAEVVGGNARRIRVKSQVTLESMAAMAQQFGLPWTTGRVSAFESGRVTPSLPTLFVAALTLSAVTGEPVKLLDLLDGDGDVTLIPADPADPGGGLVWPLTRVREALSGAPVMGLGEATVWAGSVDYRQKKLREADIRICKSLGVDPAVAAKAMLKLWNRTFSSERDERSEPGDNAQRRGQISRQLKAELQKELSRGNHT